MKYIISLVMLSLSSLVLGHEGHEQTSMSMGWVSGMLHPLLGLDHLLSLIAVAVLVTRLKGKQKVMVPMTFIALMMFGYFTAHGGLHVLTVATIEMVISASLIVAAILLVVGHMVQRHGAFNQIAAWAFTGFAVFHGMAHGIEIPVGANASMFALGFAMACALVIAGTYGIVQATARYVVTSTASNLS